MSPLSSILENKNVNLLLPDWWKLLCLLVVASKTVNSALNKNQPELGVFILPISLKMFPNCNCLLDKMVQVFRNLRSKSYKIIRTMSSGFPTCKWALTFSLSRKAVPHKKSRN